MTFNSNPEWWKNLPPRKSLFRTADGKGLPIGNLPTQSFTNFLLSFFDSYVQFVFRGSEYSYTRFVDDFVIVCNDIKKIKLSIPKLREYLAKVLQMKLHTNKHYFQKASHGVLFVGTYIKNNRKYLSNRTAARMREKVHGFIAMMEQKELTTADCARIASVLNSYLGFTRQCRTYKIRKQLLNELMCSPHFSQYFYIRGHYEVIKIKNKYKPFIPNLC